MAPAKHRAAYEDFIDNLGDKILGFQGMTQINRVAKDRNFRFDMQGLTTKDTCGKQYYNLQIQVQNESSITTLRKLAPKTAGRVLVNVEAEVTAPQVAQAFKDSNNPKLREFVEPREIKIE
ncbi:MAG: hypothetical protein M1836_006086 [Candelina mexicana]|nr:MAG: hypothetical protein M1836_006086 [Candelina mexicana]